MNTILRRLILVLKVWINALLAPADDPRQVYALAYQRQQELLGKVRDAQMNLATTRRRLESQASEAGVKLPRLEEQARQALEAGREDQARFALHLRQAASEELKDLYSQVRELEREEGILALVEQRLASQIEAFFARQEALEARYSAAEAQVHISEALGGISEELSGLGLAVEQAEQRTELMQARLSAIDELVELGVLDIPGRPGRDGPVPQLAGHGDSQAVEEQLASLKRDLTG